MNKNFFCPFGIFWYKFLSYNRGTTCAIRALKAPGALRADRAPRGFQLHEEVPFLWSSQTGGPTHKAPQAKVCLLEL